MEVLGILKKIFSNWRYTALAVIVALLFYSANVLLANYRGVSSFYSSYGVAKTLSLFLTLFVGFGNSIKLHSFISLIIISVLFGVLFSILVYKTKLINVTLPGKTGVVASVGIFLGVLAPGCAACGVGLLSALGLSAAFLSFLPFEGLELSILSIGIMIFVIIKISKSLINKNICKVEFNNQNERR